jgi:hypothetical protein
VAYLETAVSVENQYKYISVSKDIGHMRMYPKVSGMAVWSENCEWYSSLLLDAVVSLFCE